MGMQSKGVHWVGPTLIIVLAVAAAFAVAATARPRVAMAFGEVARAVYEEAESMGYPKRLP